MNRTQRRGQKKATGKNKKLTSKSLSHQKTGKKSNSSDSETLLQQALRFHQSSQIDEALSLYKKILEVESNNAIALTNISVILHNQGKWDEAEQNNRKALLITPHNADLHNNLGLVLKDQGKVDEAITCYRKALELNPKMVNGHYNLAAILKDQGRVDESVEQYQKALLINPNHSNALNNLGNIFKELGRIQEAIECYKKSLKSNPTYSSGYFNLGITYYQQGELDQAIQCYENVLQLSPHFAPAYYAIAIILNKKGQKSAAINHYQKALSINPGYVDAYYNLGCLFKELDQWSEAFSMFKTAITLNPKSSQSWIGFSQCLKKQPLSIHDETHLHNLLQMIDQPNIRPHEFSKEIVGSLRFHPDFSGVLERFRKNWDINNAAQLLTITLLLRFMAISIISDLEVERLFTHLRKCALETISSGQEENIQSLVFYCALAMHCFTNEYLYLETKAERDQIEQVEKKITNNLARGREVSPILLVILAAYRPLYSFSWSDSLSIQSRSDILLPLWVQQLSDPIHEQKIRAEIPCISPIQDSVSQSVRNQYEESPYPRWIKTALQAKPKSVKEFFQELGLSLHESDQPFSITPEVLIAGCGTGQQALLTASRFLNSQVLAIDLSLSSLSYALRKTRELQVSNIKYMQGDILELKQLDRSFDLIESVGVLHHMEHPLVGWQVLVDCLKPGGVMKIGLYSERARRHIVQARSWIAEKGYSSSSLDDIRRFRHEIFVAEQPNDSWQKSFIKISDFYYLSGCRDLLFHVQEHRFTLPEIEVALEELGLTFIGFQFGSDQTLKKFKVAFPDKESLNSLAAWHQFENENPDTFFGMYQFWVQKR
ncbi:MAG: tetratricopeptide repeat protein [Magnetococcales bacterium]|nr:tetratricopeptide repeat protein [Magnetococcales bacterium]